jgi:acetyl esterase/lipase
MMRFSPPRSVTDTLRVHLSTDDTWHVAPPGDAPRGRLFYLHGGGRTTVLTPVHWQFIARLVHASGWEAVLPEFPVVPQINHRELYPLLQDLYADQVAGTVAIAGDSSGGTLALALLQRLPQASRPLRTLLFSPWLDAALDNPDISAVEPLDPFNQRAQLVALARAFADGDDLTVPGVSPLRGPLDHLGHLTVFTATNDIMTPDVRLLQRNAGPGTSVDVLEYDRTHAFMLGDSTDRDGVAREAAEVLNAGG